jgi:stress response protein SCP2
MIEPEIVDQIAKFVAQQQVNEATLIQLRQTYPSIHFTYCSDDDIHSARPVVEHAEFNIYLVNTSEHCFTLTPNFEQATGMVLAEVVAE